MIIILTIIASLTSFSFGSEFRQVCPSNEHFTNCIKDCRVCGDPKPVTCNDSVCEWGCECDDGYVRTRRPKGTCIPLEECNNCKNPDFEFKECGSSCRSTCKDIHVVRNVCPRLCEPGCYCKGDKVWDEDTSKCISPEECKNTK